eukprot:2709051-Amphidinium_carterae.1
MMSSSAAPLLQLQECRAVAVGLDCKFLNILTGLVVTHHPWIVDPVQQLPFAQSGGQVSSTNNDPKKHMQKFNMS